MCGLFPNGPSGEGTRQRKIPSLASPSHGFLHHTIGALHYAYENFGLRCVGNFSSDLEFIEDLLDLSDKKEGTSYQDSTIG